MGSSMRHQIMYSTTAKAKADKIPTSGPVSVMDMVNDQQRFKAQPGMTEDLQRKQLVIPDNLTAKDVANSFGFHLWEKHKFNKNRRREAIERAAYVAGFDDFQKKADTEAEKEATAKLTSKNKKFSVSSKSDAKKLAAEKNKLFVVKLATNIGFVLPGTQYSSSLDDKVQKILSTRKTISLVKKFKAAGSMDSAHKVQTLVSGHMAENPSQPEGSKVMSLYDKYHDKASDLADIAMDGLGMLGDAVDSNPVGHVANGITFVHGFKKTYYAFKEAAEDKKKGNKIGSYIKKIDAVIGNITDGMGIFEEAVPGLAMVSGALSSFAAMIKLSAGAAKKSSIKSFVAKISSGEVKAESQAEKESATLRLTMMKDATNKEIVSSSMDLLDGVLKIVEGIVALASVSAGGPPLAAKLIFGGLSITTKVARKIIEMVMQNRSDKKTAAAIKEKQRHLFESEEYRSLSKRERKIVKRRAYDADNNEELADRARTIEAIELYNKVQATIHPGSTGAKLSPIDKQILVLMGFGIAPENLQYLTVEDFVQAFNMKDDNFEDRGKTASQRRDEFDQKMIDRAQTQKTRAGR